MNNRTSTYLTVLNILICGYFFISSFVLVHFFTASRTVRSDVVHELAGLVVLAVTGADQPGKHQRDHAAL